MPTYEYRCRDCGEPLEVVQSFTDDPLTVCPACGGELRKVFQAVGIAFKGSGFYKTDSRKVAKSSASSSGSEPSGSSDQKSTPSGSNGDRGSSDGAKPSSSSTSSSSSSSTAASGGT